jgi:hypothetical protein
MTAAADDRPLSPGGPPSDAAGTTGSASHPAPRPGVTRAGFFLVQVGHCRPSLSRSSREPN